jgi:hypothetical protein
MHKIFCLYEEILMFYIGYKGVKTIISKIVLQTINFTAFVQKKV